MPVSFTAIDFETANHSTASACSVGIVKVADGAVVHRQHWLIKPPFGHDVFNERNVRIHGIAPGLVQHANPWPSVARELFAVVDGDVLVAHNAGFDMGVIRAASHAWGIAVPELGYLCSLVVARRTYALDSYRLPSAAMAAGFEDFAHHDALADASACAAIILHAATRHGAGTIEQLADAACTMRSLTTGAATTDAERAPALTADARSPAPGQLIPGW